MSQNSFRVTELGICLYLALLWAFLMGSLGVRGTEKCAYTYAKNKK